MYFSYNTHTLPPSTGAKLLLTGLCSNTTVKVLDLKVNLNYAYFTGLSLALKLVCNAFPKSVISLQGNNMRGTGAEALGQLLVRNKMLRR